MGNPRVILPSFSASTALMILLGNAIPVLGVIFWGWDIFSLFVMFWLENIIMGLFMIIRILFYGLSSPWDIPGRVGMGAFFTLHYGMFCLGHGVFVFSLFSPHEFDASGFPPDFINALNPEDIPFFFWAMGGMILAESLRYFEDVRTSVPYSQTEKDKKTLSFMAAPYGRMIILHLTLIIGGMITLSLDAPQSAVIVLVVFKTLFDIGYLMRAEKKNLKPHPL